MVSNENVATRTLCLHWVPSVEEHVHVGQDNLLHIHYFRTFDILFQARGIIAACALGPEDEATVTEALVAGAYPEQFRPARRSSALLEERPRNCMPNS